MLIRVQKYRFYLFIDRFLVSVHKNDFDGATFCESSPFPPLYVERPAPLLENCFCFFNFSTFFFLTATILSRDRRVRVSSDSIRTSLLPGFEFADISRSPEYPAFCVMLDNAIFASNKLLVTLIGVPNEFSQMRSKKVK